MDDKATGMVLRVRTYSETSLIVQWLTRDSGRISTIAKGARRPKSPFLARLDFLYLADITFARSRRSDLHTLREMELLNTFPGLRRDMMRLQQAAYAVKLIEQCTETETPIEELFEMLRGFSEHVSSTPPSPISVLAFELKLLETLGVAPGATQKTVSPNALKLMEVMTIAPWPELAPLQSTDMEEELKRYLHGYLLYHLDRIPPGRAAALGGTAAKP